MREGRIEGRKIDIFWSEILYKILIRVRVGMVKIGAIGQDTFERRARRQLTAGRNLHHFRDQGRDLGDPIHGVQRSHKSDSQLGEGGRRSGNSRRRRRSVTRKGKERRKRVAVD